MQEKDLIKLIEEDLRLQYSQNNKISVGELDAKWKFLITVEPNKFINKDLTLSINALRNFRKTCIFIPDEPTFNPYIFNFRNLISGGRRGSLRTLKDSYFLIKNLGYLNFLKQYPPNRVGNPNIFKYKGCQYTFRWIRHIIFLGLFKQILEHKLGPSFCLLDLGSSYGIFSYLIKKEFPYSHNILLDFPEQLVLAYYYLGMSFPDARIAGYKEISKIDKIDKEFIKRYDFILAPWFVYKKFEPNCIDLFTNFASLGEMKREWFDFYLKSQPFLSVKYFYTVNRFQSTPTYDTDLTILDYPIGEFKKLHFRISPYFLYVYTRKYLFFYEKTYFSSQYFEFIGEKK